MLKKYRQISAMFTDTDTTSRYHKNRPIPPIPILKYRYITNVDECKVIGEFAVNAAQFCEGLLHEVYHEEKGGSCELTVGHIADVTPQRAFKV